jgi:PAS domain S-box-containing protein
MTCDLRYKKVSICFLLFWLSLYMPFWALAQSFSVDSLRKHLQKSSENEAKVLLLCDLSNAYLTIYPDSAVIYANEALTLANQLDFQRGIGIAYNTISLAYFHSSDYQNAITEAGKSVQVMREINYEAGLANALVTIGRVKLMLGSHASAIESLLESLQIREKLGDKKGTAQTLHYIGTVYANEDDHQQALEYYNKSLKISESINDREGIAQTINFIGASYRHLENYTMALHYHEEALKIDNELNNQYGMAYDLNNLAGVYAKQKRFNEAIAYHERALSIRRKIKDLQGQSYCLIRLAEIHKELGNCPKSIQFGKEGIQLADSIHLVKEIRKACLILSECFSKVGDFQKAYFYQKQGFMVNDSIFNAEKRASITNLQAHFDLEKKENEMNLLEKEKIIQKQESDIQANNRNTYLIIITAIVAIIGLLIYVNFQQKKTYQLIHKQQDDLKKAQKEIYQQKAQANEYQQKSSDYQIFIQQLIDMIPYPIFYKDGHGILAGCNESFSNYLGLPKNKIIGKKNYVNVLESNNGQQNGVQNGQQNGYHTDKDMEIIQMAKVRNQSKIYSGEESFKNSDGSLWDAWVLKSPYQNSKGAVDGMVGVLIDISERKKIDKELKIKGDSFQQIVNYAHQFPKNFVLDENHLSKFFREHFVLQQFGYQDNSINFSVLFEKNNKILLVFGECKDKGVKGILSSLLYLQLIHKIVPQHEFEEVEMILNFLNLEIHHSSQQMTLEKPSSLAISFLTIEKRKRKAHFAGAMNNIFYAQNGMIQELKSESVLIGGKNNGHAKLFSKQELEIDFPTTFYWFSPSLKNQLGEECIRPHLSHIQKFELATQKQDLHKKLNEWIHQKENHSLHDLCVLAWKV